jgi:[acyl-carrier-protein] S-malonyltransferase
MNNVVLLFSGQGAQRPGMCLDWFASERVARSMMVKADHAMDFRLSEVMFDGPDDELTRTSRCQPALYVHGLVGLALLKQRLPDLNVVAAAGLSLGEFTAHAAAGTFSFEEGLRLVARRGAFMEEACLATKGSMAAMIGGDEDAVRKLAADSDVDVANYNAPGQIVLSGSEAGIDAAVANAKEAGVRRALKLNVAGAYHSRLMRSAQEKLAAELATAAIGVPEIPVVCNFGATVVSEAGEIRSMLEKQVTGSVRWAESIKLLRAQGHTTFLELGPGKVLAGLVAKIDKDAVVYSIEDMASLDAAVEALS